MGIPHILPSYLATLQSKMKNLAIALFSTLVAFSSASYWEVGPCPPKPEVVTPFDAERYLGNWYTVYETPMPYTTRENVCTMSQVGLLPQGMNNMSVWAISTYPGNELGEAPCAWMQPVTPTRPTQQATLVKRAHWDTSRMLPSPPGIPLRLKK